MEFTGWASVSAVVAGREVRDLHSLVALDRSSGAVAVKGIRNPIRHATVLGHGPVPARKIGGAPWAGLPGVTWIDVPETAIDPLGAVAKLELDGPLDLYTGAGNSITFNH